MQARLRIENSGANLRSVRLPAELVIGRSADCRLKIASAEVSRKHCRILNTDTGVLVEDLGSSNGTLVNGRAIIPGIPTPLTNGALLLVGPVRFILEIESPPRRDQQNVLDDDESTSRRGGFSFEDFQRESAESSVSLRPAGDEGPASGDATGQMTVDLGGQASTIDVGLPDPAWLQPAEPESTADRTAKDSGDDLGRFLRNL
ncbi:FHA domain-containing protein [Planctellipticum variicoloris]|uniref:FHA domain-containing protein n=1 Tax=Planctellipticum variicoloris TaxID=3064265 RepID=UPI002C311D47|nr:FHA domain-containing protein [Planctomycetaceae bacterium SH412]HTN02174.1 FHA domain-containing protein [Planctomycetaceae bacterium]